MRRISLNISLFLAAVFAATSSAHAVVYDFNAQFTNNGAATSAPFRMWLPNAAAGPAGTADPVRGMIFVLPGSGEDWRNVAQTVGMQRAAQSLGFGLIAARSMIWGVEDSEVNGVVQGVLNAAATISNRPEIVNAPYASMGVSQGGYNASRIALANPERAIAFVDIRGVYGRDLPPMGSPVLDVPGLDIVASEDIIVSPEVTFSQWAAWRSIDAPHALLVDWDTTHYDTRKGQSWETAMYWIGEAARQRHPGNAPLSTTPGVLPTLSSLDYSAGWLAETPQLYGGSPSASAPPQIAEIASLASGAFSEQPSTASWVPSEGAAMVYRAFASSDGISRALTPLRPHQSPLYLMLDPVHDTNTYLAPLFEVGDLVPITAAMRSQELSNNGITIESVDFYVDNRYVGTNESHGSFGDFSWTLNMRFKSPGIHALIAVGHGSTGHEYSTFRTVLVEGAAIPEPTSLVTVLVAVVSLASLPSIRRVRVRQIRHG